MIRASGIGCSACYALTVCCFLARFCSAEEIAIRVINAKDGQTVGGLPLWLYLGEKLDRGRLEATTSPDGTAVFHLPSPLVERVFVVEEVSGKVRGCSWGGFPTRQIFERGVVAANKCDPKGKLRGKFTPKPGEVIVFVRFLKWWEKMQT